MSQRMILFLVATLAAIVSTVAGMMADGASLAAALAVGSAELALALGGTYGAKRMVARRKALAEDRALAKRGPK